MESAGDPVPIDAAAFDPDLFLCEPIYAWGIIANPRAIESLRLLLCQKVVHGSNSGFEIHDDDCSTENTIFVQ